MLRTLATSAAALLALAPALAGRLETRGKTVALTLSGGNVDPESYREMLAAEGPTPA